MLVRSLENPPFPSWSSSVFRARFQLVRGTLLTGLALEPEPSIKPARTHPTVTYLAHVMEHGLIVSREPCPNVR